MKVAIVHNDYGKFSGEEAVVTDQVNFLTEGGHEVVFFRRNSTDIKGLWGAVKAFFSGIYNPFARRKFRRFLEVEKPDLIHVHNLFPLISPSVLPECRRSGIPTLMSVHNYRLVCPTGLFLRNGQSCVKCENGIREFNCILHNCEHSIFKSTGYALRSFVARVFRLYKDNIDGYIMLSEFQRNILIKEGFPGDHMFVMRNTLLTKHNVRYNPKSGKDKYVTYVARISAEKGIDLILAAARKLPHINFIIAGDGRVELLRDLPPNVKYIGFIFGDEKNKLIAESAIFLAASRWFEGYPISMLEALVIGTPLVVPDFGVMPEVAGAGGELFAPGDADSFAEKIEKLWNDEELCRQMGKAAREHYLAKNSPDVYFKKLMEIYTDIIAEKKQINDANAQKNL